LEACFSQCVADGGLSGKEIDEGKTEAEAHTVKTVKAFNRKNARCYVIKWQGDKIDYNKKYL